MLGPRTWRYSTGPLLAIMAASLCCVLKIPTKLAALRNPSRPYMKRWRGWAWIGMRGPMSAEPMALIGRASAKRSINSTCRRCWAEQERDRLEKQADAYANRVLAQARGEAAQALETAEAYRAQVVNGATGEASRFGAILNEYRKAPEVTRKRMYLETMEEVLGRLDKVIIDENGGSGVVPYLPLNELRKEAK